MTLPLILISAAATGSLFQSCDPSEEKVSECGQGQVCDLRSRRCQCIFGSFKLSEDMTCVQAQPVTTEKPVILTDIYILGKVQQNLYRIRMLNLPQYVKFISKSKQIPFCILDVC